MAENPAGPAGTAVPPSDFLALKVALREQNLSRLNTLLTESTEDDDGIPEGLDERTAAYLVEMTGKVKSNLLTLNEHHNSDMGNLLDALANEQTKLGLVQAKLSTALNTIDEFRSESALKTSEMNNFKENFSKLLSVVNAVIPDTVAHVAASTNIGQVSSDSDYRSDSRLRYKPPYKVKEIIEEHVFGDGDIPSQVTIFARQISCNCFGMQRLRMYEELSHGPRYVDRFQREALLYVAQHPDYDKAGYTHFDEYSYIYLHTDDGKVDKYKLGGDFEAFIEKLHKSVELEHPIKSSYNQKSERFYSPLNSTRMNRKTWIENDAVLSQLFLQWIANGSYKSNSTITKLQDHFQSGKAGPGQLSFILKSLEEFFDYSPELKLAQLDVEMYQINVKLPELPVQIWWKKQEKIIDQIMIINPGYDRDTAERNLLSRVRSSIIASYAVTEHDWFSNSPKAEVEFYRTFHIICIALSRSAELRKSVSNSSPPTREVRLLLDMDSWSGLGKIINDVKRNFEDYDLDEIAASHLAAKVHTEPPEPADFSGRQPEDAVPPATPTPSPSTAFATTPSRAERPAAVAARARALEQFRSPTSLGKDTPFTRTSAAHPSIRKTPPGKGRLLPEAKSSTDVLSALKKIRGLTFPKHKYENLGNAQLLQLVSEINKCAHEVLQLRGNTYKIAHAKLTEHLDELNSEIERRCQFHQIILPDSYSEDDMYEALLAHTEADPDSELNDFLTYGSNSHYSEEVPDFQSGGSPM